jgi:hypothetical protein
MCLHGAVHVLACFDWQLHVLAVHNVQCLQGAGVTIHTMVSDHGHLGNDFEDAHLDVLFFLFGRPKFFFLQNFFYFFFFFRKIEHIKISPPPTRKGPTQTSL